jgi:3-hydroxyisobutyrate dehydrogenase-like beta-hydroxyacid dehydrogenase
LSDTLFVDLNSVSPGTKHSVCELIENAGGRFVEASVMSPILPRRSASPILLSGRHGAEFADMSRQLCFSNVRVVSEDPGVAAATKMCRSVIIKGMEALVTESLLAARYYGVEATVLASLENLFPGQDWSEQSRYLISRSLQHGGRRAAEMREVARTVEEAGYTPWMSEGCVQRQAWAPQFAAALKEESLDAMLDSIRTQSTTK